MDSRGVTLTSIASVAAVFAATSVSSRAPLTGLVAILVAVIAIITLIRWERRARHPFFDAAVMHQKRFQVALSVNTARIEKGSLQVTVHAKIVGTQVPYPEGTFSVR